MLVGVAVGTGVGVGVSVDVGSGVAVDVGGAVAEGIVVGGAGSASSVRDSADEVATDGESAAAPPWVRESCILDSFTTIESGVGTGVGSGSLFSAITAGAAVGTGAAAGAAGATVGAGAEASWTCTA